MSIFGPEFEKIWPKAGDILNFTDFGKNLLRKCKDIKKPDIEQYPVDIEAFKTKSSNFPLEFGTNTCRVMSQPKERYPFIQKQIASAYPLIHERVLKLYLDFLEHKCQYGNSIEKSLYENFSLSDLVERLLKKRCAAFVGPNDLYLLLNGARGDGNNYQNVGTEQESAPLTLNNVLSYDEIKLSAFLSVSSYTECINDGNRYNRGIIEEDINKIVPEGVVVGLIGARFERPELMEYQDIVIDEQQNILAKGYGGPNDAICMDNNTKNDSYIKQLIYYRQLWNNFYNENDYLYEKVLQDKDNLRFHNFSQLRRGLFDNVMMKKRYAISFDTLLLEAQARASQASCQAYIHIVGIGLGVWRIVQHQTQIFLECFMQRVIYLLTKLTNIGVLHFSWFHMTEWHNLKDDGLIPSNNHPNGGIKTFLSNRNPNEKLPPEYEKMLLIVSYAWDGNALPGNEFWLKSLDGSNDPSTACSTLISELHNPHINDQLVCANNLHIASLDFGILHISDYVRKIQTNF